MDDQRAAFEAWYVRFYNEPLPPEYQIVHVYECWQASRAQALEEAAKVCDRLTHALDHAGVSYHRPATADRCASAIRSIDGRGKV